MLVLLYSAAAKVAPEDLLERPSVVHATRMAARDWVSQLALSR